MEALEKFLKRVESATKSRSKEIRLNTIEAQQMTVEITQLLMRENQLLQQIVHMQTGKTADGGDPYKDLVVNATIDGGKFGS